MSQWDALHHKDVFPGAAAVPALPCKAWALLEHCSGALSFCGQESGQGQQGCTGRPSVTRGGAGALCRELLVEEPGRASLAASRGLPASDMEGCWTVTISSELVYTFPTLLHLSAEGQAFRAPLARHRRGCYSCQKPQLLLSAVGWTWLGAAARAPPKGPARLWGRCGSQVPIVELPRAPRFL